MKNKTTKHTALRAAGLIALTAIITLTSVSCLSSGSGVGTLTLTDIPSKYNGKYVVLEASGVNTDIYLMGARSINHERGELFFVRISGGRAVIPLMSWNEDDNYTRYSGSGRFEIEITIFEGETEESEELAFLEFESVRISNGSGTISFIDADEIDEE
ncbi:MAG: hypothetical protein FWB86_14835 [Treponema sp.]|nr:hypothetical protein [Treponema sp.]